MKWEELKAQVEEEQRKAEQQRRVDAEQRARTDEQQQRTQAAQKAQRERIHQQRARLENERWSTTERAYHTWGQRIKASIDIVHEYSERFASDYNAQFAKFSKRTFDVYAPVDYVLGGFWGRFGLGNKYVPVEKVIHSFRIGDLTYELTDSRPIVGDVFVVKLGSHKIYRFGWADRDGRLRPSDHADLEEAIMKVFVPKIVADRIETVGSEIINGARYFLIHGEHIRKLSPACYSFSCEYSEGATDLEDTVTTLKVAFTTLGTSNIRILNPMVFRQKFQSEILGPISIVTHLREHRWEGRGQWSGTQGTEWFDAYKTVNP